MLKKKLKKKVIVYVKKIWKRKGLSHLRFFLTRLVAQLEDQEQQKIVTAWIYMNKPHLKLKSTLVYAYKAHACSYKSCSLSLNVKTKGDRQKLISRVARDEPNLFLRVS
jgi:hypothetical protein